MARAFFAGVSHTTPSTPGVFLPSLFVTRLHGKGFAAERVGQQMLQGMHLAPSSRLHCLHDTRLEPPHVAVDGVPIDGVPVPPPVESAPVSVATAVICLLSCGGWPSSLVMKDQMDVCPLSRGVMLRGGLNPYPPHYRMAFASSILLFPHAYRLALRLAFPHGRRTGLPCSVSVTTNGLGALCPPVACDAHDKERGVLVPATVPFWLKPASTFGLFSLTMFIERSPGFALPSILAPSPSWC